MRARARSLLIRAGRRLSPSRHRRRRQPAIAGARRPMPLPRGLDFGDIGLAAAVALFERGARVARRLALLFGPGERDQRAVAAGEFAGLRGRRSNRCGCRAEPRSAAIGCRRLRCRRRLRRTLARRRRCRSAPAGRPNQEDLRVTRRCLAGRWRFSGSHEHVGGAFAASVFSESNFSTYCKTTHT